MADVTGPISTLPGSSHSLPSGARCDRHSDRPAVARIQGETDSLGSEMNDLCQECLDELRAYYSSPEASTGVCDWCRKEATTLRDRRDYEEGMSGPLYRVCAECVQHENDRLKEECSYDDSWDPDLDS